MSGSMYATPFVLHRDNSNHYKVDGLIEKSMNYPSAIPFLRSKLDSNLVQQNSGFGDRRSSTNLRRSVKLRQIKQLNRKEQGWN